MICTDTNLPLQNIIGAVGKVYRVRRRKVEGVDVSHHLGFSQIPAEHTLKCSRRDVVGQLQPTDELEKSLPAQYQR